MANEPIITIIGNLTADPDLRYTQAGIPVAGFTVASTPREKNTQTGEYEDGEPLFVRCSAWRDMGDNVAASLQKGTRVIVQGRLQSRSYEKDGQQHRSLELQVDEVGPALRWATAQVQKAGRSGGGWSGGGGRDTTHGTPPAGAQPSWEQPNIDYDNFSDAPPF